MLGLGLVLWLCVGESEGEIEGLGLVAWVRVRFRLKCRVSIWL